MRSSFNYGGKEIALVGEARFCDGAFTAEKTEEKFACGAVLYTTYFKQGEGVSKKLSNVCDLAHEFEFEGYRVSRNGFYGYGDDGIKVTATEGGDFGDNEFMPRTEAIMERGRYYCNRGGRSSQGWCPFFDVGDGTRGFLLAIGWTGQWFCHFTAQDGVITVRAGIEGVSTVLNAGESIRTASILILPYQNGSDNAHNVFRKLMRERFSIIGRGARESVPPTCMSSWGGSGEQFLTKQIRQSAEERLGFEYYWMDAGWYGSYEGDSPSEFADNWFPHTGDWNVNKNVYANGLEPVFSVAKECGMKGLLWLEPERAQITSEFYKAHPELFLYVGGDSALLNLGDERARQYMFDTVAHYVRALDLKCYRQDFNIDPLAYWQAEDRKAPDRAGMAQIKYIMGLYEVLDRLLDEFPELIIDNCASGGRRLDIEMTQRGIVLWRSDMSCAFDVVPAVMQAHNVGLSRWLVHHGCGVGFNMDNEYLVRSCHASTLTSNFMGYKSNADAVKDFDKIRANIAEYKALRSLYEKDFYPIFGYGANDTAWGGWQFEDGEIKRGVIAAFRRKNCLSREVTVFPGGVNAELTYVFEEMGSGNVFSIRGTELKNRGLTLICERPETAVLLKYYAK